MSNKLPANISNLIGTLETAQKATPVTQGDFQYLKLAKDGTWVYGADETEVSSDSVFVIDPSSYAQGYIAWDDGELVDEVMAVAGQTPVTMGDLPPLSAGLKWDAQVAFALLGIEGPQEGVQMLYKSSSKGGKDAIAELLAKIIERGKSGEADLCPVVVLEQSSYKHKKYGKIYTPILSVDEWMDMVTPDTSAEPVAAIAEPEPEPEPAPEPKRKRRSRKAA
jgi:hypothetical protein